MTTYLTLLPAAPTATDSPTTFPVTANDFFNSVYIMVGNINLTTRGLGTATLADLPLSPQALDAAFATDADTYLAGFPGMVTSINTIISDLSLPCSSITTLPATPSRGSDPTNFSSEGAAFLAAMTTLRTELNDFITALIAYNPSHLLLSGDMQSGTDVLLLSGDMQTGTDKIKLSGSF